MGEGFWRGCGGDFVNVGWDRAIHSNDDGAVSNGLDPLRVCLR